MGNENIRARDPRSGQQRVQLGDHFVGRPRHRYRVAAADIGGIENGARPIIGAHLGEGRDSGEDRHQASARFDRPDLAIVAVAGNEDDGRCAGAPAFEMDLAAADVD
jgi:hypothetical protein